jgi:hypothetical protein
MRSLIQGFGGLLAPIAHRFSRKLDRPKEAQRRVQKEICDRLVASEYGQKLGICSLDDWQRIPIVTYDDLIPWISPLGQRDLPNPEEKNNPKSKMVSLLTPEPILFYERTSGTSGKAKYIPYTRSLRRSFNQMFCVWAHDLISQGPRFATGKIYFCISPQFSGSAGLQDDSEYLDRWLQLFLSPFLISPKGIERLNTPAAFKWELCRTLLQAERLETISIWSPSFLKILLDFITAHRQELRQGLRISSSRDRLLDEAEIPWTELWSELKLISCWDSVTSADSAAGLRLQFPGVLVQGKGLLATEAPMTIPLIPARGCVPVLDEVFFEFADRDGKLHLLHELQLGADYTVILSQKGGLYRYEIGDRVRVTHFYRSTPCLEFIGRNSGTSDLVGEKLTETAVSAILNSLNLDPAIFKTLVPVIKPEPHYVLLLERSPIESSILSDRLDTLLCDLPHYRHARLLGQLTQAEVYVCDRLSEILTQHRSNSGQSWGDIKHSNLWHPPISKLSSLLSEITNPI